MRLARRRGPRRVSTAPPRSRGRAARCTRSWRRRRPPTSWRRRRPPTGPTGSSGRCPRSRTAAGRSASSPGGATWSSAPTASCVAPRRAGAVAVCRDIWELLTDERSRGAVEVAERFADGRATVRECRVAYKSASDAYFGLCEVYGRDQRPAAGIPSLAAWAARDAVDTHANAGRAADSAASTAGEGLAGGDRTGQRRVRERQGRLLAAIVGPGYGLIPEWHTPDAVALARSCYETGDRSIMPVLADAPQDAGCDNDDVRDHCRGPGPHVRGDWVLDSLSGLN